MERSRRSGAWLASATGHSSQNRAKGTTLRSSDSGREAPVRVHHDVHRRPDRLIPAALLAGRCPGPCCNGGNAVWVCGECVPCGTAGIDDGGVAVVDAIAEVVGPEKGPDVFHRVRPRRIGRQWQQADVVWHAQLAAAPVPARAVEGDHGMCAGGDPAADFGEVQRHGRAVGHGRHETSTNAAGGTDRAEQVGRVVALVARRWRAAALVGPNAGQGALLADSCLVLPPELDRLVTGGFRDRGRDEGGEAFSCASWAAASCAGCCGRTDSRRKPSRRSSLPTVRSASLTSKRVAITAARSARRQRATPCSAGSGPWRTGSATTASCSGGSRGLGPTWPRRSDKPARPSAL